MIKSQEKAPKPGWKEKSNFGDILLDFIGLIRIKTDT